MKKLLVFLCIALMLCLCVIKMPSRADFGDFGGDNDFGGGYDYDGGNDYDYDGGGYYFFGGTSGGSGGGSFFEIAVVIVIVALIIMSAVKKQKGGTGSSGGTPVHTGTRVTDASALRPISQYRELDPNFDETRFCDRMGNLYMQLQECWTKKDLEPLRPYLTDELYNMSDKQLDNYRRTGNTNYVNKIAILERQILGFRQENGKDCIHLLLKTRITDYTLDRDGRLVSGSQTAEKFMTYEWVLVRTSGVITQENADTTRKVSCPNCGAPLDINASARCEYCGSVITVNNEDWVISTIKGISQVTR